MTQPHFLLADDTVMANPVKAGLVARARDWPGLTVLPQELGRRTLVIERPSVFFRPGNSKWAALRLR